MAAGARGIQSIEVGGRILEQFARTMRPMTLQDLAIATAIAPAQVHAYLVSFRKLELVEQDSKSGKYQLGPFALRLGFSRLLSYQPLKAVSIAASELNHTLGLTVAVVVWGCGAPTIVQVLRGPEEISMNSRQGTVYGVTTTVSGRIFAAFMDNSEIRRRIEEEFSDPALYAVSGTRLTRKKFTALVREVRRRGVATGVGVGLPGISAISAPVFDSTKKLLCAITLIGRSGAMSVALTGTPVRKLIATLGRLNSSFEEIPAKPRQWPKKRGVAA